LNLKCLAIAYLAVFLLTPLAFAKDIVVAFSPYKPPYVIDKEVRGLEIDIVRETLALEGLTLKIDFFDRRYLRQAIKFDRTDAAAGLQVKDDYFIILMMILNLRPLLIYKGTSLLHGEWHIRY
jgi:hypothetical protein